MFYQCARDQTAPPLYSCVQKFYVKSSFGDERSRDLRIVVDVTSAFNKVSKQVLNVQVLDDDDPFFYYNLLVTEDDYLKLKTSQGLLVDFDSFPAQVVRLLEHCKHQESTTAKFLLLLEDDGRAEFGKTFLKIVETNNFKHLCHLILQIERGSDDDVKKIMVKKIQSLKEQNSQSEKTILSLESQLSSRNLSLEAAEVKIKETERRWKEERAAYQQETAKGLTEETEKLRRAQLDWQIKTQREKAELEEKYQIKIKEKEQELSKMKIEVQILSDKRTRLEDTIAQQTHKIDSLEKELSSIRLDLSATRKNCVKMENDLREKDRSVATLKMKASNMEHEVREKSVLLAKLEETIKAAQEAKARLEGNLLEKEAYVAKKQKTIQNVSEELIKANEIIGKLQKELSGAAAKLKTRTEIALEQEKVIEKHERVIERLDKELKVKLKKLETLDDSEEVLRTTIAELKDALETKDKKIRENEKIIDWLNRRCTEQAVQSYSACPTSELPSTTPAFGKADLKTSTPLDRFKDGRVPFSTMNTPPSRFNIQDLDKFAIPAIDEEDPSENEEPSPQSVKTKDGQMSDPKSSDKKKASPVDPPRMNNKPSVKRVANLSKKSTTPMVPSSYFLN